MHVEQRQRARDLLRTRGVDRALFAYPGSVTWLTGFAPAIQLGTHLFAGGPNLVWYDGEKFTLIALDAQADDATAFAQAAEGGVETYLSYTIEAPMRSAETLAQVLQRVVKASSVQGGTIGIEEHHLPVWLAQAFRDALPSQVKFTPIDRWLERPRMIKTDEEVAILRANFKFIELGQAAARQAVQVGQREIDVWTDVQSAVERAAGRRMAMGNDCTVGHRAMNVGGWPLDLKIVPHDSFIVDLSVIQHGYWGDSCATYYADGPTERQVAMHNTVHDALHFAISLLKPGAVARDVDRQVRQFIADAGYPVYPHHTGHAVGISGHEAPRLVPYNDEVIEAGMVLMVEPGIYFPNDTGVRLEDAVLVTATGNEVLTTHDKSM